MILDRFVALGVHVAFRCYVRFVSHSVVRFTFHDRMIDRVFAGFGGPGRSREIVAGLAIVISWPVVRFDPGVWVQARIGAVGRIGRVHRRAWRGQGSPMHHDAHLFLGFRFPSTRLIL